ncbi:DUF4258 domain-containing protein [Bacteriovoracaceae bacterium]|nr:DUF4258 domain-containing protein [Bacteriovoracaceae bacterium]
MKMNKDDELNKIIEDLSSNTFEYSDHALIRMSERGISPTSVLHLIQKGLNNYYWNEKHKSWNFTGQGLVPEDFTISCIYEDGTLVVTLFWE